MARRRWNKETIQQVMSDENPFIQVGYKPAEVQRKVGERWQDVKGITWEQRKGYKMRINVQVESIRELLKQVCSVCKKDVHLVGTRYDEKVFGRTGKCYDCLIDDHSKLMINGGIKEHEQKVVWSNQLSYLKDMKKHIEETLDVLSKKTDTKTEMVHADGSITTWEADPLDVLLESAKSDLVKVNEGIKQLEEALENLNKK